MVFTYPDDQKRIWKALQIRDPEQLIQDTRKSKLYKLMQEREAFDLANSTDLVDDILDLLDQLESLADRMTQYLGRTTPKDIKSMDSYLEGKVEFEGSSTLSVLSKQKSEIVENIRALIDPCGCFSVHWGQVEVIPS